MFNTADSQPQEWLNNRADAFHTLCVCRFVDSESARRWIHQLIPRDQNAAFTKWSSRRGPRAHAHRRRDFVDQLIRTYGDWDFSIHCVSSTEGEISTFANAFYLQNLERFRQQSDHKGRNNLVFRLDDGRDVSIPVLRAAKLIWIYFALKYLREQCGLDGFIFSDWFACDSVAGVEGPVGVGMVNLLLKGGGLGIQLSIPIQPSKAEADLLSDWVAGWCNSSLSGGADPYLSAAFASIVQRPENKLDWVRYTCNYGIVDPG